VNDLLVMQNPALVPKRLRFALGPFGNDSNWNSISVYQNQPGRVYPKEALVLEDSPRPRAHGNWLLTGTLVSPQAMTPPNARSALGKHEV